METMDVARNLSSGGGIHEAEGPKFEAKVQERERGCWGVAMSPLTIS